MREDRDVELARARRHPDADPVAAAHARELQPRRRRDHPRHQLAVAERALAVVERRGLRIPQRRLAQDVEQGARWGRERRCAQDSGHRVLVSFTRVRAPIVAAHYAVDESDTERHQLFISAQ